MNFRISIFIFILLHDILRKNEGDIIMNELETKVKKIIISRYGTVKKFADIINLPYSTVDTILKRGFKNSNAYNVGLIFGALQLDTRSILDGKIRPIVLDEVEDFESFEDFERLPDTYIDELIHSGEYNDIMTRILENFKKMGRKEQYTMLKFMKYIAECEPKLHDNYFNTSDQDE